jgi:hypothetical protein
MKSLRPERWHFIVAVSCFSLGFTIFGVGMVLGLLGGAVKPMLVIVSVIAAPLIAFGSRQLYKAKRLSIPDAHTVLANDKGPPVLYLRSFQDDACGLKLPSWLVLKGIQLRSQTHEESVADVLRSIGPVVAIGRPGEPMPELGAHRMYVADDRWQDEVKMLMNRARLVVLRLGASPGLKWEFKTMAASVPPERILLYLEPPGRPPAELWRLLPCGRIGPPRGRYISFSPDWTPRSGRNLWPILYKAGLVGIPVGTIVKVALGVLVAVTVSWYSDVGRVFVLAVCAVCIWRGVRKVVS